MHMSNMRKLLAILTALVFCTVVLMHPYISHEHPHEYGESSALSAVHLATAEKQILFLGLVFFVFAATLAGRGQSVLTEILLRRMAHPETYSRPILHHAFAQGILHPKSY